MIRRPGGSLERNFFYHKKPPDGTSFWKIYGMYYVHTDENLINNFSGQTLNLKALTVGYVTNNIVNKKNVSSFANEIVFSKIRRTYTGQT